MNGYIKSFVESKSYGFIKGEDNKDYFFHISNINSKSKTRIKDNRKVTFESIATKKGYAAININIHESKISDNYKYIVPNEVYFSKDAKVKGWETVETCNYMLIGTSANSPDDAKRDIIDSANTIGANALQNFEYFKTTGSKPGTGSGTYYFTVHNFRGYPINIAKKTKDGFLSLQETKTDLEFTANLYYENAIKKTRQSTFKMLIIWSIIVGLLYVLYTTDFIKELGINEFFTGIGAILIGFIFGRRTNYSYWIKEIY